MSTDRWPGSSVWFVAQRSLSAQRRGRFVAGSGDHPGRMAPDLAAEVIRRYTDPGDLVLDPMCGIGTTLVEAVHAGRHAIGIECEAQWADLARANLELAARQGAAGTGHVVTADARQLARNPTLAQTNRSGRPRGQGVEAVRRVKVVLTSPAYGPSAHGRVQVPGDRPVVSHLHETFTPNRKDTTNLAHADESGLRAGLADIFQGCRGLLVPDGLVIVAARPWRGDGLLIDLPGIITDAAEHAGLTLVDRCVAVLAAHRHGRLIPRHSFHQLTTTRQARRTGDTRLLLAHEDVLVYQPDANSSSPHAWRPSPDARLQATAPGGHRTRRP